MTDLDPSFGGTFIVTGANSGVGFEVAKSLCERGFDVVIGCRNLERGEDAVRRIKETSAEAKLLLLQIDLADLESVRRFVDEFHATKKRLFCLINNAGMTPAFRDKKIVLTNDGVERTIASNYLGHFLLTNLLLDDLKKFAAEFGDARIVNVSSELHAGGAMGERYQVIDLDLDDLSYQSNPDRFSGMQAYKDSKALQILFTYELAKRLEETGVTVTAVSPGFIPSTNLGRETFDSMWFSWLWKPLFTFTMRYVARVAKPVEYGRDAVCNLAASCDLKGQSGKYFQGPTETISSPETRNESSQTKCWDVSVNLVGL